MVSECNIHPSLDPPAFATLQISSGSEGECLQNNLKRSHPLPALVAASLESCLNTNTNLKSGGLIFYIK